MTGRRAWLGFLLFASCLEAAAAQSLEGVLMPGPVIRGHAKLEQECANCHVRFDKAAQDRLCLDCHKDVARDVRDERGYHGRIRIESCRACHTDHKGRDALIAVVDPKAFDHSKTDFALAAAHGKVACRSCHVPGAKFRAAPLDCNACHRKDDKHRGTLGTRCADCHAETRWKEVRFDHGKTRFPLTQKHADVPCAKCHIDNAFKNTPLACSGCHRKDDHHKGHLGEKCETCHSASGWRDVSLFDHDRDTKYPLKGKHRSAKCESCHTGPSLRDRPPQTCVGCHRVDDKHNGTLGPQCADCHVERGWKEARFDHDTSTFPLRGKHHDVECKDCHKDPKSFKGTPAECFACHRKDDKHRTRYGERCATCHTAVSWRAKDVTFRHERDTKYALVGKHATTRCDDCHKGDLYRDKLIAADCNACHAKDDKHQGQLGPSCGSCHNESGWKVERFDHNRTRFPLSGRHARIDCQSCHKSLAFRSAPRECYGCHEKDDKHKLALGRNCGSCHNTRDWRAWDFDHRKTKFPLDGAHARTACAACHRAPAEEPLRLATACVECHRKDDRHEGAYGPLCERCHVTSSFREIKTLAVPGRVSEGRRE